MPLIFGRVRSFECLEVAAACEGFEVGEGASGSNRLKCDEIIFQNALIKNYKCLFRTIEECPHRFDKIVCRCFAAD